MVDHPYVAKAEKQLSKLFLFHSQTDNEPFQILYVPTRTFFPITNNVPTILKDGDPVTLLMTAEQARMAWIIHLINGGQKKCTDVALTLPNVFYVRISRPGSPVVEKPLSGLIELGDVRNGEAIEVIGWTDSYTSYFDLKNLSLVHSEGIGSIHVSWVSEAIRQKLPLIIFEIFMVVMFSLLIISVSKGFIVPPQDKPNPPPPSTGHAS